ncbi:MAG TPA: helix-turn-helix domain-containing protein [Gemmatimonadales bacterium]|nr:helix-turn-helix domain-containing protein [Gemmatimonadales bacterium]
MVELRQQGFSMNEIAADVGRSERTVRRYVRGVTPELRVDDQTGTGVDVFEWCANELLKNKERLGLSLRTIDLLVKRLRPVLGAKDEWTLSRMAESEALRREFLWKEFWRSVVPEIRNARAIRDIFAELGVDDTDLLV